jgi:LacI family transcriptional regulator
LVTVNDISKACNVSRITVIRALNNHESVAEKTRKRVVNVSRQLGYAPNAIAKQLQSGRSNTIAVVLNKCVTGHIGKMLEGVQRELSESGYDSLTYEWSQFRGGGISLAGKIAQNRVEGVVMIQWSHDYEIDFFSEIARYGICVIAIDREADYGGVKCVVYDDHQGAKLAIDYLVSMGHTEIGHIGGLPEHSSAKERLMGFYSSMASHNLPVRSDWVIQGDYRYHRALMTVEKFFDKNQANLPTAVFAGSDIIAATIIQVAAKRGIRVPDDISIVGFCDEVFAEFLTPALTTIRQHPYEVSKKGAEMIVGMIEAKYSGEEFICPKKTITPVSFVERESVRRLSR